MKDPNEELTFRISSVGNTGVTETRKVKGWKATYARYKMLTNLPHMQYVLVVDITDRDPTYWSIKEEWKRP